MKSVLGLSGKQNLGNCFALTALAKAIGRSRNVKVVFSRFASTASTDGKTITLPIFPSFGSEAQFVLMNALLDHECGHVRLTDFEVWTSKIEAFMLKYGKRSARIFKGFMNSIEDYWMENAFAKIYPGCRKNILLGVPHLIDAHFYDFDPSMDSNPHSEIHAYILLDLCAKCYGHPTLVQNASSYKQKVIDRFGEELESKFCDLLLRADTIKSTSEASDLAEELFLLIHDSEDSKVQEIISNASEKHEGDLGDKITELVQTMTQMQGDLTEPITGEVGDPDLQPREEAEVDTFEAMENLIRYDAVNDKHLADSMIRARGIVAPLIGRSVERRISDLIQSRLECGSYYRDSGRRLATSRIAGLATGNFNIFRMDEEADGVNTVFSLVLDTSTSMTAPSMSCEGVQNTSPLAALLPVYWQIGSALSANDVPFNVWTFGRKVVLYKSFDASWQKTKERPMHLTNSTRTDTAVYEATQSLMNRPEAKRVLILITDGDPGYLNAAMGEISMAQKAGIKVVFLFLGETNSLHSTLKKFDVIAPLCTSVEDITNAFSEAVELAIAE